MADRAFVAWEELALGCAVVKAGSAADLKTGDWKSLAPTVDEEKCIKCGLCMLYCPEFCISQNAEGYYHADLNYCKGCGICSFECPKDAISMGKEGK